MKDVDLNNKQTAELDAGNGNTVVVSETGDLTEGEKEDDNKNEKDFQSTNKSTDNMSNTNTNIEHTQSYENGRDETDKVADAEQKEQAIAAIPEFVPKYKYSEDQWSPLNKTGKKYYEIGLLKQIKDEPISKDKPNIPLLETCNIIRQTPILEPLSLSSISRPNDNLFHPFAKAGTTPRGNPPRDAKKDGRSMSTSGKGSAKMTLTPRGSSSQKPIIHVSLSLREEVKLNEGESAWKPTRLRKENLSEEEYKTEELYKKFRGILNKLTPQKFDTLLDKVKSLEITDQKRLNGVIDLVFQKAIDEPNFSEAYAVMCNRLSMLKVPADNPTTPDQCVNFRALIINRCQKQFEADQVDEQVLKLEKDLAQCTDPVKKKELQAMLEEENRRVRMKSVGNVRFIGELYKLKMLTCKIMEYCMRYLIEKLEEEKLECLCKLLTTIGEQIEAEPNNQLDVIFKRMHDITQDRRSNKISSRVRFMIQDVIDLRKRKWVAKGMMDSQPKTMDQIQQEAEMQHKLIELMNTNPGGANYRRDDGGRSKRGDSRRQGSNMFQDNSRKSPRTNYSVDMNKLKAVTQKNLTNIKLAPHMSMWNHGSGSAKTPVQPSSNSMISLSKNMYSVLANVETDPVSIKDNRDTTPSYHLKSASIERSTFNSKNDFGIAGGKSGSTGGAHSVAGAQAGTQEPLPAAQAKCVKTILDSFLVNGDRLELLTEMRGFAPHHHSALVAEIFNVAVEKSAKDVETIATVLVNLTPACSIASEHLISGMKDTFEFAPDLLIDIPKLYEFLATLVVPHIERKHITIEQIFKLCDAIIASGHGPLLLKAIFNQLLESMGPTYVKIKWQESGLQLSQWMNEDQVAQWVQDNQLEFLEGEGKPSCVTQEPFVPEVTRAKLLQLMKADESWECINGWLQDKVGEAMVEERAVETVTQAVFEHALASGSGAATRAGLCPERLQKYAPLLLQGCINKRTREISCLFGIQELVHRLEHPRGLSLAIFQFLHENYIISSNSFVEWEESERAPEGKGVMLKALTSFFTNIQETDNDSCYED